MHRVDARTRGRAGDERKEGLERLEVTDVLRHACTHGTGSCDPQPTAYTHGNRDRLGHMLALCAHLEHCVQRRCQI